MNGLLKNLQSLMEKKIALYEKFIRVLQSEWDHVVGYKLGPMQETLQDKAELVERLQRLEKERSQLMHKIAVQLEVSPSKLTLRKLLQTRKSPFNEGLTRCRGKLLSLITKINQLMDRTKRLMDHSSLSLKKSLAFVHSAVEAVVAPYHSNGRVLEGKLQGKMLSMDV